MENAECLVLYRTLLYSTYRWLSTVLASKINEQLSQFAQSMLRTSGLAFSFMSFHAGVILWPWRALQRNVLHRLKDIHGSGIEGEIRCDVLVCFQKRKAEFQFEAYRAVAKGREESAF